jgi:hypothetical protein
MMDAFDQCLQKLDKINDDLRKIRQYNRDTTFLALILWGFGLPLTLFVSVIWTAWRLTSH